MTSCLKFLSVEHSTAVWNSFRLSGPTECMVSVLTYREHLQYMFISAVYSWARLQWMRRHLLPRCTSWHRYGQVQIMTYLVRIVAPLPTHCVRSSELEVCQPGLTGFRGYSTPDAFTAKKPLQVQKLLANRPWKLEYLRQRVL